MRSFPAKWAVVLAGLFLVSCSGIPGSGGTSEIADTILFNGKIVTVDAKSSIAQAVAIRGNRIVAVGSDADVRRHAGGATRLVDLRGRTVLPGLMDGHLHNAGGGPGVDLSRVRSMGQMAAALSHELNQPLAAHYGVPGVSGEPPFARLRSAA